MKIRNIVSMAAAGLLAVNVSAPALAAGTEQSPVKQEITAADTLRVGSIKGNTLNAGDRSLLIIGPFGDEYTAKSDAPSIVDVEQVLGFWVAVAKADGKAKVTVTNRAGASATVEITVGAGMEKTAATEAEERDDGLDDNLEIRQEMVRLINAHRKEHGLTELPVNDSIMDAAQDVSSKRPTGHSLYEWESLASHGWPHGGGVNHTRFNGLQMIDSIEGHAVNNWINSHYHNLTMLDERATCLGVGVTICNGTAYAVMIIGIPNSISPIG